MGAPMLDALRDAGTGAAGFDIVQSEKAFILSDVVAFANTVETLFIVVRDETQTCSLLTGEQNLLAHAPNLRRIVLNATVSPRFVSWLRSEVPGHIALIDAPMSGARIAAERRNLTFMLGGTDADVEDLTPLLATMGQTFHHMGPLGAGMRAKVLNNLLAAANTATTRMVLDWAKGSNVDEQKLLDVIATSSGQNWFASGIDDIEFAADGYRADNSIGLLVKDVAAALDSAPEGADPILPQTLMTILRNLKPRK